MKYAEMNDNQKRVFELVFEAANEIIGGYENSIEDGDEPEYFKGLLANHDELVKSIYSEVRASTAWRMNENLHTVTLEWLMERCEKRVKKMGY